MNIMMDFMTCEHFRCHDVVRFLTLISLTYFTLSRMLFVRVTLLSLHGISVMDLGAVDGNKRHHIFTLILFPFWYKS